MQQAFKTAGPVDTGFKQSANKETGKRRTWDDILSISFSSSPNPLPTSKVLLLQKVIFFPPQRIEGYVGRRLRDTGEFIGVEFDDRLD